MTKLQLLTAALAAVFADLGYLADRAMRGVRTRIWLASLPRAKRAFARAVMAIFPRHKVRFMTSGLVVLECHDKEWREKAVYFDPEGRVEVMDWHEAFGTRHFYIRWADGEVYIFPDGDYPTPAWLEWILS